MDEEILLIRRIQKTGSREEAEKLIKKYYDEIYIYVFKQISDKNTAMDLTQDIFIAVLKSIQRYDHRLSTFRTWLYRIATNKTIDHLRSRTARRMIILDVGDIEFTDEKEFTSYIETKDLVLRLQSYINTLEVDIQQIFRLKFYGENTFDKIASLLCIPEPTVKSKYYRLLKQLRKEFSDEYKNA